jgi:flagellar protein FliS
MFSPARTHASAYRSIGNETAVAQATPHHLVAMLFDGAIEAIAQARGAMQARDWQAKGKAVRIVDEGLKAALDYRAGGELAMQMGSVYSYVLQRLTQANLHNDDAAFAECTKLLDTLRQGWMSITSTAR